MYGSSPILVFVDFDFFLCEIGGLVLEQRPLQDGDWEQYEIGGSKLA